MIQYIEKKIYPIAIFVILICFPCKILSGPMVTRAVNKAQLPSWIKLPDWSVPGSYSAKRKQSNNDNDAAPFLGGRPARREAAKERAKHAKKVMRDMNLSELHERKNELITQHHDKFTAIKYLEKMIPLCDDLGKKSVYILELADLYFDTGKLTDAENRYQEYVLLYPGEEEVKYAKYKMILCVHYMILDSDRDQERTQQTRKLAQEFLRDYEHFSPYAKEVHALLAASDKRLFDAEIYVCNFYLDNNCFKAAKQRLEKAAIDFNGIVPEGAGIIQTVHDQLLEKQKELGMPILFQLEADLLQGSTRAVIKADAPTKKLMIDYF